MELGSEFWAALVVVLLGAAGAGMVLLRRRRQSRDEAALEAAVARNLHVPLSLHPVIDPDICIGSLSCLQACPEGDILGIVDGRAHLIRGANCIGHGRCALECPVNAIRLVFGTSERGVDLPEVDEFFESSRAGVHVVGELGGMGLIKNAVSQGVQVAEHLSGALAALSDPGEPERVDVAIVGSGPAGLAAAVTLGERGRSFRVLEQGTLGGTISQYPRQKVVMTDPVDLPGYGKFGKSLISKEELLSTWQQILAKTGVRVDEGTKVTGLQGDDGRFEVQTDKGVVLARKVVLACGRRGSPRKLGVPGEELSKVTYRLLSAEQYQGCKVLVVGGGDSALEAAIQLAEESDAEIALSYRNAELGRCRDANREKFTELVAQRRIRALFSSNVAEIRPREVALKVGEQTLNVPNDFVIVCAGGELPLEFLNKMGVDVKRYHGEALTKSPAARARAVTEPVRRRPGLTNVTPEERSHRRLALGLFALGALIVAGLVVVGYPYYLLPAKARAASPLHKMLRPAGAWGHGVGLAATGFMLLNFLYAVRKRWRLLKGTAPIKTWLTFHMFVGFMSPLVIAFHAAFQFNNQLAAATTASLLVVVGTGVVGRYVYGLVPTQGGTALEYAEVLGAFERLRLQVEPLLEGLANAAPLRLIFAEAAADPKQMHGSFLLFLLRLPLDSARVRLRLLLSSRVFGDRTVAAEFRTAVLHLLRLRAQVHFYKNLKKLLGGWRVFHAVLAGLLVFMIAAHIAVSFYLGYRWIF